jgi:nitroreductase/NAD-dependent dihydropyrimidine dehydrogenase PreA subunit
MDTPTIDLDRCRRDGLCARVCPTTALRVGPGGVPAVQPGVPCYACGQCAAVCPQGAVRVAGASPDDLEPLPPGWRLDPERVGRLLRGRRSVRAFRPEPLPRAALLEILTTAQHAPSPFNLQPIAWVVLGTAPAVRRVADAVAGWMRRTTEERSPLAGALGLPALLAAWDAGTDTVCRGAPHLLVAHAPAADPGGSVTGAVAVTTAAVAALPHGAGSCWAGLVPLAAPASPEVTRALALPEGRACAGALLVGYPAVEVRRVPRRRAPAVEWR